LLLLRFDEPRCPPAGPSSAPWSYLPSRQSAWTSTLYTEESTEVWFTDCGFGKLERARARVLLDPGFAQTIAAEEPYHVFVQPYGRAEVYVAERTRWASLSRIQAPGLRAEAARGGAVGGQTRAVDDYESP